LGAEFGKSRSRNSFRTTAGEVHSSGGGNCLGRSLKAEVCKSSNGVPERGGQDFSEIPSGGYESGLRRRGRGGKRGRLGSGEIQQRRLSTNDQKVMSLGHPNLREREGKRTLVDFEGV